MQIVAGRNTFEDQKRWQINHKTMELWNGKLYTYICLAFANMEATLQKSQFGRMKSPARLQTPIAMTDTLLLGITTEKRVRSQPTFQLWIAWALERLVEKPHTETKHPGKTAHYPCRQFSLYIICDHGERIREWASPLAVTMFRRTDHPLSLPSAVVFVVRGAYDGGSRFGRNGWFVEIGENNARLRGTACACQVGINWRLMLVVNSHQH